MLVCDEPKFVYDQTDTIANLLLIIEVLSKSTPDQDKGDKFDAYWSLPSLQEYILIDQHRPWVKYTRRRTNKIWELEVLTALTEILNFKSIEVSLPLEAVYRRVKFD